MSGALPFLIGRSARNAAAARLGQLRNPRYLIAVLVGVIYLWYSVLGHRPRRGVPPDPAWLELGTAVLGLLLVLWSWLFATERRALVFSPAEVVLLFPAPLTRRALIHYKLARAQLMVLLNTLLWTLLLTAERLGTPTWYRTASVWVALSTLQLHRLGASFVRTSLLQHGWQGLRRRLVPVAVALLAVVLLAIVVAGAVPVIRDAAAGGPTAVVQALLHASHRPLPAVLLWPFRIMARALAARTPEAWLTAIGPALLVLLAHYVWVIRSETAFEESAAEVSFRRAREIQARRGGPTPPSGGTSAPLYRLAPMGRPAAAILWKNLAMVARRRQVRLGVLVTAALGAVAVILSRRPDPTAAEVMGLMALMAAGFLFIGDSQIARNDLRADLLKLDLLRTYPVGSAALVTAEVAASALLASALQLGLLLIAYLSVLGRTDFPLGLGQRTMLLAAALVVVPAVSAVSLTIQNALALLFPAWVRLGVHRPGGVEALGQTLLSALIHLALLGLALLAPATVAWAAAWQLSSAIGDWAWAPALLIALAGVALELFLALQWLGDVFDRTDASVIAPDRTS